MRRRVFVGDFANQHHAQTDYQFGNRARVGIRRVKNRDTVFHRRLEIYLIRADAKRADGEKFVRRFENFFRDLSFRTDAQDMNAFDRFDQIVFADRAGNPFDLGVTARFEFGNRRVGNIFEQKNFDFTARI